MKSIMKNIFINILSFSVLYTNAENVINILINKPDIGETQYLEKYNGVIKQYLSSKNNINFDINFSYCVPNSSDGEKIAALYNSKKGLFQADSNFAREFNCTLNELKNSNFDMMILGDRFLFSDYSYLDNSVLQSEFAFKKLTDYYENFNDLKINKENLSHHNNNILKDGYFNGNEKKFYGLPYGFDFDMLYYHQESASSKNILSAKVENPSYLNDIDSNIFSAGFGNNDILLNFFTEFIRYQYDIPQENNPMSYNVLFNGTNHEIYESFRNYMIKLTGEEVISKPLEISIVDAYNAFVNNEKKVFLGKASYFKLLKENQNITISTQSLPNGESVINENFIVINKNSKLNKDLLLQAALELTSPEIQLYRAQELGIIPTFDLNNNSNSFVNNYCSQNSDICEIFKNLNPIHIGKIYRRSQYSASLMEVRLVLPLSLKKYLIEDNISFIEMTFSNIIDLWNNSFITTLAFSSFLVAFLILNVITIGAAIFLIVVIFKVHKNRKHPYIKAMSPQLTNLTIFGMILRIIYPYFFNLVKTRILCRLISCVANFFINNLVYVPLFAIIFRIYYIYTNITSVSYGKKLHDKRLIRYIILYIIVINAAFYGLTAFDEFNLITTGTISITRSIACVYNFDKYTLISNVYTLILFILMMGMTIKVHKLSKKYGDTRFIFFIVILLLSSFLFEMAFSSFMKNDNLDTISPSSVFLINLHLVVSVITVHVLIGKRLLYVKKHPYKGGKKHSSDYYNNVDNIVKFIPMKKNSKSTFSTFDKSTTTTSKTDNKSSTYIVVNDTSFGKNDPLMSGSNKYRSFVHTLQSYNQGEEYNSRHNSIFNDNYYDNNDIDYTQNLYRNNNDNGVKFNEPVYNYNFNNNLNYSSNDNIITSPKASLQYFNNLKN